MATMHDLRVSVRDKMKTISELEVKIKDLEADIVRKDATIYEYEAKLKKKDDVIAMKDLIIKEKDAAINKLENNLRNSSSPTTSTVDSSKTLSVINENSNSSSNHVGASTLPATPRTTHRTTTTPVSPVKKTNAEPAVTLTLPPPKVTRQQPPEHKLPTPHQQLNSKAKRLAISAEPAQLNKKNKDKVSLKEYDKSDELKEFLRNGILDNEFMKNLEMEQINSIVKCMYPIEYQKDSLIIVEGDVGNLVYIVDEGSVEVIKNLKPVVKMGSGKLFGELAILYNCTRTASVKALTHCKCWAIDRLTFQTIMMRFGIEKQAEYMELLKSVPNFQGLREDILMKFVDILDECHYNNGEYIIRQYAKGNTFYIISRGQVKVTKSNSKWETPALVKTMTRGDFFGEDALVKEETRGFNVIVDDPNGVSCLVLEREAYNEMMDDPEVTNFKREESIKQYRRTQTCVIAADDEELNMANIRLSEFEILTTLGVGGFGRVELVRNTRDSRTYGLKIMKKQYIVAMKQQEHVMNERNILFEAKSKFICKLYKTFKDRKYLYMVLELCLGGELWSLLRDRSFFEENDTKFYIACVTEALQYLHSKGIIYRDLKPENVLIDGKGYCKLVDFGFAKKVGLGKKTWTFCGTPEYVAPEIILNKGHDVACDYWSLGILIFELLSGNPPFVGQDPMATYNAILKGIEAVDFPRQIPKTAAVLIKKLCRESAVERYGYQRGGMKDIQKHKWFEGFSWENFRKGTLEAPYVPNLDSNVDTSNFDKYAEDNEPEPEDDVSGWEIGF